MRITTFVTVLKSTTLSVDVKYPLHVRKLSNFEDFYQFHHVNNIARCASSKYWSILIFPFEKSFSRQIWLFTGLAHLDFEASCKINLPIRCLSKIDKTNRPWLRVPTFRYKHPDVLGTNRAWNIPSID